MSDNQLFLDYLRKKNSLDPLESKNDEKWIKLMDNFRLLSAKIEFEALIKERTVN